MPQTVVGSLRQPVAVGEGQLATTSIDRIEGAISTLQNAQNAVLPFGRVVQRNAAGTGVTLPTAAAAAATPIAGVTIMNERYGIPLATLTAANLPTFTVGNIPEGVVGYPNTPIVPVEVLTFGDIWMITEEAITAADLMITPIAYRFAGGTAPFNVAGRILKTVTASQTELLPGARALTVAPAGGLVIVRLGAFGGSVGAY